jgi:hypothetical protein
MRPQSCKSDCRSGVARCWLKQDRSAFDPHGVELIEDKESLLLASHDDRRKERLSPAPLGGRLKEGLVFDDRQELLGCARPRERPQARAAATGKNNWPN